MKTYSLRAACVLGVALACGLGNAAQAATFCPALYTKGVLPLKFMPGFVHVDQFADGAGLSISSFLNAGKNPNFPNSGPPYIPFAPDLVAAIPKLDQLDYSKFDNNTQVKVLNSSSMVWPNEAEMLPKGMLPFNALIAPQGFISAPKPGRLSIINLDDPNKTEYIVHQSTQSQGSPQDPANSPRAYHKAVFYDMDGDGRLDIMTVRSGFKVGSTTYPPYGELVWFKNPGTNLRADQPWQETVLWGGAQANFMGPDISLIMADLEGDGVPEIIATHFFNGSSTNPPTGGKIAIYGAPLGAKWKDVNLATGKLPRVKDISSDQGFPFAVTAVDLNRDGRVDILASNHAPDNCTPQTSSAVPGRVYALEMPRDRKVFTSPWTTRVLLDNIRPNPSLPGTTGSGRLAPGKAQAFYSQRSQQGYVKPMIVVGGDEAGKVWLLRAQSSLDSTNWNYDVAMIFDLNQTYGANTTQTPIASGPAQGRTKSTIGGVAWRYDRNGYAEIFMPAYEAQDVHVYSFAYGGATRKVPCISETRLACPVR